MVHQQPLCRDISWINGNRNLALSNHVKGYIKCLECDIKYGNLQMLREHLFEHHNLNYIEKEICFPNMIAFKKWKLDIERRDHTFFFATHGIQKGSKCNRCLYSCHQSGNYEANDREDKHKMNNNAGSLKIGITCTAAMTVCEYANEVCVKYCLQHYGHGQGTTLGQLSTEEQVAINENVSKGIPLQEQLDDIKHAHLLAEHFQARLIQIRDAHFLNTAYASEIYNAGMKAIEYVEQWVRACFEMENSPILLYRQEGIETKNDDLMLIIMTEFQKHILMTSTKEVVCLDSHRCVKKGSNVLSVLVVMDEQDVAFPVAFCISSKMNKSSMLEFFSSVKKSTGPLSCLYFMSNNDKTCYDAWQEVMQDKSRWIWSIWSFDDYIRKHLVRLLKHVPTREATYQLLRTIMECNNQHVFGTMLKNFMNSLSDNKLCNDFGKFFELQCGSDLEMWALCYRTDLKFSTNFCLEYLHKTLLHCIRRSRNKQLDKFLMVLMKFLRFKMIDRLSNMLDEERIHLAKKTITVCHNMGLDIECENINSLSDKVWLIQSKNEVDAYVTQEYVSCPELCDLRCPDCDVCVHMYSCTCVQSMINANMCKHIHAIVWKFLTPHFSPPTSPVPDPFDIVSDLLDNDPDIPTKEPDLLQSILERMQCVYKQVQMNKCQLNKNSLLEVLRLLDRCYQICSYGDTSFALVSKSTQTEAVSVVSSLNPINSLNKAASSSDSENIAPISMAQSKFGCNIRTNAILNSSKLHENYNILPVTSSIPLFLAVKNIALNSEGNPKPTSIIIVPSDCNWNPVNNTTLNTSDLIPLTQSNPALNNLVNSASSVSREKQVATIIVSALSNPFLNVSSEKFKTVVIPSNSAPSAVTESLSTSERPQKRTLMNISPDLVQDSISKNRPVVKRRCLRKSHFPDVSSSLITNSPLVMKTVAASLADLSNVSVNTLSNSFSQVSPIIETSSAVLKNCSGYSKMSLNAKPATVLISTSSNSSDLTTNYFDEILCAEKTSDKMSSPCNILYPSSSKNQNKFDAPCVIESIYSLKNISDVDNKMDSKCTQFSPLSINEYKSTFLLDSVSKKCDIMKTTVSSSDNLFDKSINTESNLNSQISSVVKPTPIMGLFPCIPKSEPFSDDELSVLPCSSNLSSTHVKSSVPVLVKASKPSILPPSASSNSPIVIKYPDSTKLKSVTESILNRDLNGDTENVSSLKIRSKRLNKTTCLVCEAHGPVLFRIPSNENMHKKWFSALKWNVPPEQLKYVLNNARVCGQHFSESCFTSTLKRKLLKFACPHIMEDMPSTLSVTHSVVPSPAS